MPFTVIFRTDASPAIGGGHVMRCLTLATELKTRGADCIFYVGDGTVETAPHLGRSGFATHRIETGADAFREALALRSIRADLIIFDHYAIERDHEARVADRSAFLMVIDDLANRPHHCDLLLDQTPGRRQSAYAALVPGGCQLLTGSEFALLRADFLQCADLSRKRRSTLPRAERLLLSMGLTDVGGITADILGFLRQTPFEHIDVVAPRSAASRPYAERSASEDSRIRLHDADANMAELMLHADIAVGGAGTTSLERCCLGLPTVMLRLADNQAAIAAELSGRGAALVAENAETAVRMAWELASDPGRLREMSANAATLVDGQGAKRVSQAIRDLCAPVAAGSMSAATVAENAVQLSLRSATIDDAMRLFEWRADPDTRRQSLDSSELSWTDHLSWLNAKLASPTSTLLIAEVNGPVGTVRIDRIMEGENTISILSWTVAPDARGQGYGKLILQAARPDGRVRAYIKRGNVASQAIAAAAGLRLIEDAELQRWEAGP